MYNEEDFYDDEDLFTTEEENILTRLKYKGYIFYVRIGYDENNMTPYWVLKNDKFGECWIQLKKNKGCKRRF